MLGDGDAFFYEVYIVPRVYSLTHSHASWKGLFQSWRRRRRGRGGGSFVIQISRERESCFRLPREGEERINSLAEQICWIREKERGGG